MPTNEIRTDLLTGRRVIIAEGRRARPVQNRASRTEVSSSDDPFLEGCEAETPDERLALRSEDTAANQPGWLVRVVPNRYPAVQPLSAGQNRQLTGIHNVVLECPDFRTRLLDLDVIEIARVMRAWQLRIRGIELETSGRTGDLYLFRNEGREAGASLAHCHSQILWLPTGDQRDHRTTEQQLEQWLSKELKEERRLVARHEDLAVICPFASRVSWHTRIIPTCTLPFCELSASNLITIASLTKQLVRTIEQLIGSFPHNVTLNQATGQWYLDLMPRTGGIAGLELMSDLDLVTVAPETACQQLQMHQSAAEIPTEDALEPSGYRWRIAPNLNLQVKCPR